MRKHQNLSWPKCGGSTREIWRHSIDCTQRCWRRLDGEFCSKATPKHTNTPKLQAMDLSMGLPITLNSEIERWRRGIGLQRISDQQSSIWLPSTVKIGHLCCKRLLIAHNRTQQSCPIFTVDGNQIDDC